MFAKLGLITIAKIQSQINIELSHSFTSTCYLLNKKIIGRNVEALVQNQTKVKQQPAVRQQDFNQRP